MGDKITERAISRWCNGGGNCKERHQIRKRNKHAALDAGIEEKHPQEYERKTWGQDQIVTKPSYLYLYSLIPADKYF